MCSSWSDAFQLGRQVAAAKDCKVYELTLPGEAEALHNLRHNDQGRSPDVFRIELPVGLQAVKKAQHRWRPVHEGVQVLGGHEVLGAGPPPRHRRTWPRSPRNHAVVKHPSPSRMARRAK
ncbi:unnamed protein product [Polarella glacialis]|uniref:Uncharacterized protein n=1 Tax=Polarella glacialis TaxID=89957 RepID=A0A813HEP3_POLGL|nr:unnamed protein product [Polarella glacialis]